MTLPTLLAVDDEEKTLRLLDINLGTRYRVLLASSGRQAINLLSTEAVDIVLTDLRMPGVDGAAILDHVRRTDAEMPVVVMTAYGTIANAVAMIKDGAFDYIVKPFDLDDLDITLGRAAEHRALIRENHRLRAELKARAGTTAILTASPAMQRIVDTVIQIAATPFSVLVEGETGSGKEVVARAIHAQGTRPDGPFIAVNCAAIPHELLESEFFGSERGAFTGATVSRAGTFERANGGTLFLDEIGELPIDLQAKLLRVLEEHVVVRIGGKEQISLDVRLIAATNRTLRSEVEQKRFRADLYYRLNVVHIILPPLRERPEDVPLLAEHFLLKHRGVMGRDVQGFDARALRLLSAQPWPGNVRELENVVVRSMVRAQAPVILPADLPEDLHAPLLDRGEAVPVKYQEFLVYKRRMKDLYVHDLERAYVLERLRENAWNISRTARNTGIDRRSLHAMVKSLGLRDLEPE